MSIELQDLIARRLYFLYLAGCDFGKISVKPIDSFVSPGNHVLKATLRAGKKPEPMPLQVVASEIRLKLFLT